MRKTAIISELITTGFSFGGLASAEGWCCGSAMRHRSALMARYPDAAGLDTTGATVKFGTAGRGVWVAGGCVLVKPVAASV